MSKDAKPMSFWKALDASIEHQDPRHSKDVSIYPSESSIKAKNEHGEDVVLGGCLRKSWFRNKKQRVERDKEWQSKLVPVIEAEPFTADTLWMFSVSSGVEDDITNEAKRAKIWFDNSYKFEWEIPSPRKNLLINALVRGEVDLIVKNAPDSEDLTGIEIKSVDGYYGQRGVFGKWSKKGYWIQVPEPKEANLMQSILYTYVFVEKIKMFKDFKLVYMSRENGTRIEYDVALKKEKKGLRVLVNNIPYKYEIYAEDLLNRYIELHHHLHDDTLPERDFSLQYSASRLKKMYERKELSKTDNAKYEKTKKLTKGDWQCSYCPYTHLCYDKGKPIQY